MTFDKNGKKSYYFKIFIFSTIEISPNKTFPLSQEDSFRCSITGLELFGSQVFYSESQSFHSGIDNANNKCWV